MATEPYRPSNGTEGLIFMGRFCGRCERDRAYREDPEHNEGCPLIAYALAFEIDHPKYPKEWVRDVDSDPTLIGWPGARCTAFVEEGKEVPYRCPATIEMFK
jgi:hypothetical protein